MLSFLGTRSFSRSEHIPPFHRCSRSIDAVAAAGAVAVLTNVFIHLGTYHEDAMEIREVDWSNPADARAVLELNIELQREGYTRHGLNMAPEHEALLRAKLIADLSSLPEIVAFLAWEDEEAVAILLCRRGYSTYAVQRTIYCEDLWVSHQFRRRGIARALIQYVFEFARSKEYARVELTTTTNNQAAGTLYESFEFSCAAPIADGRLSEALRTMQLDPAEYAVVLKRSVS